MADKKISALTGATTPLAGTEVLPIVQSGATVKVAVSNLTAGRDISASGATFTKAGVTQVTIENTTGTTKNTQLIFADNVGSKWRVGMDVFTNDGTNELQVYSDTATNAPVRINTSGNLTLPYGNLVIGTSGKGIDFSATPGTGTSELLNDYEEGTWTPAFTNCGTASASSAKYTKVGRLVTIQLTMTATSLVANSSFFTLPFASGALSSGTYSRSTLEGGFVEVQASSACYFSSTPTLTTGSFTVTATYSV